MLIFDQFFFLFLFHSVFSMVGLKRFFFNDCKALIKKRLKIIKHICVKVIEYIFAVAVNLLLGICEK